MAVEEKRKRGSRNSTHEKLAISVPRELARAAREEVWAGHAPSLSAFVARALQDKLERDRLQEVLDQMAAEYGPLTAEELAWADRVLEG